MVEAENLRKKQQIIDICNENGYENIDNWTVITTLTPNIIGQILYEIFAYRLSELF